MLRSLESSLTDPKVVVALGDPKIALEGLNKALEASIRPWETSTRPKRGLDWALTGPD